MTSLDTVCAQFSENIRSKKPVHRLHFQTKRPDRPRSPNPSIDISSTRTLAAIVKHWALKKQALGVFLFSKREG